MAYRAKRDAERKIQKTVCVLLGIGQALHAKMFTRAPKFALPTFLLPRKRRRVWKPSYLHLHER